MQRLFNGQEQVDPAQVAGAVDAALGARLSDAMPRREATQAAPGTGTGIPRDDHQHPRLASAVVGSITAGNTATIAFTRTFSAEPTIDYCELPPTPDTTVPASADTAGAAQPTMAKVIAWTMGPTAALPNAAPTDYTGCTIRVWKSQTVPQNLATLLLGGVFNLFAASVVGTRFSVIALARSDV